LIHGLKKNLIFRWIKKEKWVGSRKRGKGGREKIRHPTGGAAEAAESSGGRHQAQKDQTGLVL
jgi:hypothetical protein